MTVSSFRYVQRESGGDKVRSARLSFSDGTFQDVSFDPSQTETTTNIVPTRTSYVSFNNLTETYTQYNPGIKEIQFFLAANVASIASCDAHSEYLFFVCEMAYDGLAYTSWAVQSMSIFSQYGWKDLGTGHVTFTFTDPAAVHQVYIENRQGINDRTYQARLSFDDGRHEEISLSRDQFGAVYTLKDTHVTRSVHYDIIDASGNPGNPEYPKSVSSFCTRWRVSPAARRTIGTCTTAHTRTTRI